MSVDNRVRPKKNYGNCLFCGLNIWSRKRQYRQRCCSKNCKQSWYILNGFIAHPLAEELKNKFIRYGGSFYVTIKWLNIRQLVLKRDGYRCLACGSAGNLSVDHIVPISHCKGGYLKMQNLQTLCLPCNKNKGTKHIRYSPIAIRSTL